jgi:hypothetical protein
MLGFNGSVVRAPAESGRQAVGMMRWMVFSVLVLFIGSGRESAHSPGLILFAGCPVAAGAGR